MQDGKRLGIALILQNVVTLSVNLVDNIMLGAYSDHIKSRCEVSICFLYGFLYFRDLIPTFVASVLFSALAMSHRILIPAKYSSFLQIKQEENEILYHVF